MSERLTNARSLKAGDVVTVAVQLKDKVTGKDFWWTRFACVQRASGVHVEVVTLKLHVNPDKDIRIEDVNKAVVVKLDESAWPQGVIAMRMKLLMTGVVKLEGG